MNKLELSGFINLINEIKESEETITISEFFDHCINKAEETIMNQSCFVIVSYIKSNKEIGKIYCNSIKLFYQSYNRFIGDKL